VVRLDRDLHPARPAAPDVEAFEAALDANDEAIAPSMLYGYAAIMEGCAYANGAPNLAVDVPALVQLANERGVASAARTSRPARPG
jgi:myo-inositol-1-phosphate synthase